MTEAVRPRSKRAKRRDGEVKGSNGEVKLPKEAQQLPSQPAQVLGSGSGSGVEEHGDLFAVWVRGGRCRPARREAQMRVRRNQATLSAGAGGGGESRRWCVVKEDGDEQKHHRPSSGKGFLLLSVALCANPCNASGTCPSQTRMWRPLQYEYS